MNTILLRMERKRTDFYCSALFILRLSIVAVLLLSPFPQVVYAASLTNSPTTNTGTAWTDPANAYADGGGVATITSAKPSGNNVWGTYGFSLAGYTITQVRIRYDALTGGNENIRIDVSWDGGTTWSAQQVTALTDTEATYWYDVTAETAWTPAKLANGQLQVRADAYTVGGAGSVSLDWLPVEVTYTAGATAPTVTTSAATSVEATTATGNGNITDTGGENCDERGFDWDIDSGAPYTNSATDLGSFPAGAYTKSITSLPSGTTIYYRAKAHNSAGWGYGGELTFLTKPAAPTTVAATDGSDTSKVVITWTKSTGATDYQVYRDAAPLGWIGDLATYDDTGADAPTITPGSTVSSDGTSTLHVSLNLSGTSANDGTTHTYKVRAKNATGESVDSATDTGYRGVGALGYQWQRSAADSDAGYGNIIGATASTYDDTTAPAPTVTPGTASSSDGTSSLQITLSVSGESGNNGDGRWYQCVLTADGAGGQTSSADRGYRGIDTLTYQWYRSAADSDAGYGSLGGATTDPYNDTTAPAPTVTPGTADASDGTSGSYVTLAVSGETGNIAAGRYYYAVVSMSGAASGNTTHDRGYRGTDTLTYQWRRSSADADADFSNIVGATTDPYNDTGGVVDPDGRYYYAEVSMPGASTQDTTHDRGYMSPGGGPPTSPPPAPSAFSIIAVSNEEIQATWNEVPEATGYLLLVSTVAYPNDPYGNSVVAFSGNATTVNLIGFSLDFNTYFFSLWSHSNPYSGGYAIAEIGGESMDAIALAFEQFVMLLPLVILSILAFWKSNALLFMLAGGTSIMVGLYWYDIYTTDLGLGISLMLIAYSLLCLGLAFRFIFWREDILD